MSSQCSHPELAQKLHAYELGMLAETDRELVEVHLVECESCYSEIKALEKAAIILRSNEVIRDLAESLESESAPSNNGIIWLEKLSKAIWPRRSYLKALPVAVVLLLVSIGLLQLLPERDQQEQVQQTLNLFPMRGGEDNFLTLDRGAHAVINFVYESFDQEKAYDLLIISDGGQVVYSLIEFSDFSDAGLGAITVSLDIFKKGIYKLAIIESASDPPETKEEYYFMVDDGDSQ